MGRAKPYPGRGATRGAATHAHARRPTVTVLYLATTVASRYPGAGPEGVGAVVHPAARRRAVRDERSARVRPGGRAVRRSEPRRTASRPRRLPEQPVVKPSPGDAFARHAIVIQPFHHIVITDSTEGAPCAFCDAWIPGPRRPIRPPILYTVSQSCLRAESTREHQRRYLVAVESVEVAGRQGFGHATGEPTASRGMTAEAMPTSQRPNECEGVWLGGRDSNPDNVVQTPCTDSRRLLFVLSSPRFSSPRPPSRGLSFVLVRSSAVCLIEHRGGARLLQARRQGLGDRSRLLASRLLVGNDR